jgi:hypothetical protein
VRSYSTLFVCTNVNRLSLICKFLFKWNANQENYAWIYTPRIAKIERYFLILSTKTVKILKLGVGMHSWLRQHQFNWNIAVYNKTLNVSSLGKCCFIFPPISMFFSDNVSEMLTILGKQHCFPREQTFRVCYTTEKWSTTCWWVLK